MRGTEYSPSTMNAASFAAASTSPESWEKATGIRLVVIGLPRASVSCTRGAPSASASSGEKTAGSGSYSTSINSTASRAVSASIAATAATSSRNWRTTPPLSAKLSRRKPIRSSGVFSAVTTAWTPGSASAFEVSMRTMRACACSENLIFPHSIPGTVMSWM